MKPLWWCSSSSSILNEVISSFSFVKVQSFDDFSCVDRNTIDRRTKQLLQRSSAPEISDLFGCFWSLDSSSMAVTSCVCVLRAGGWWGRKNWWRSAYNPRPHQKIRAAFNFRWRERTFSRVTFRLATRFGGIWIFWWLGNLHRLVLLLFNSEQMHRISHVFGYKWSLV